MTRSQTLLIDRINTPNILFDGYIHECAAALYTTIQQTPNLYQEPLKNNSGLCIFYQFGTYEIPLFWWLKYRISNLVYNTQESVKDLDIRSFKLYPVDGYEHRLSKDSFIISKMPIPTTLQTFWSRINTHELEIFDKVTDYMVQALEEFTMDHTFFDTSIVMNCPEKFKINASSFVKHQSNKHDMTNFESTLDDVFYPQQTGQSLKIRGPNNVPIGLHRSSLGQVWHENSNTCKLPINPGSDLESLPIFDTPDKIVVRAYAALIGELLYIAINTEPQLTYSGP